MSVPSTSAQQWSALSALYEEADELSPAELSAWLAKLEADQHPLFPQLSAMLAARERLATDDFLNELPRIVEPEPPTASPWHPGDCVGAWCLVRPLGEGGMAEVWLAERHDGAFKRQVAIKLPFPRPGRETFAVRFDRERDILATLRHPNIANLFDAGVTPEGQAWIALEYVHGEPIGEWCDARRLPVRERVQLFRQVLLAVQHAHANLVIHRDLKPANILVTADAQVRLLDFGIAKLLEAEGDTIGETELTRVAGRALTPRYASPEQLLGKPLSTSSDVYSLGVVLYEMLCGERPYELRAESLAQLEHAIIDVDPRAPSRRSLTEEHAGSRGAHPKQLRRILAPELDAIALKCLAKTPAQRYSSVDAVLADIDRWLDGEAVLARAPGAWVRFGKFALKHKIGVGLGVAAVAGLMATTAIAVTMGLHAREESARAGAARDFMLSLFRRADQEKSRGADITAREILETGRNDLLTRMNGQPRLQAELLHGIGRIEASMGEFVNAEKTFGESARVYELLQMPREAATNLIAEADSALRSGSVDVARGLVGRAVNVFAGISTDVALRADLNQMEGWLAIRSGDLNRARRLFVDSRRDAVAAFGPDHVKALDAVAGLIDVEVGAGDIDEALALQIQREAIASRNNELTTKQKLTVEADRVLLLYNAGRYAEGIPYAQKTHARCDQLLGPNETQCRQLLVDKVRMLMRINAFADAERDRPALNKLANDSLFPALQADALLSLYRLNFFNATLSSSQISNRVEQMAEGKAERASDPMLRLRAMLTVADIHLRAGDVVVGKKWLDEAAALQAATFPNRPLLISAVRKSLEAIYMLALAEPQRALDLQTQAQEEFQIAAGANHPVANLFALNGAFMLLDLGRIEEARALIARLQLPLEKSYGPNAPVYRKYLMLQSEFSKGASSRAGGAKRPASEFFS